MLVMGDLTRGRFRLAGSDPKSADRLPPGRGSDDVIITGFTYRWSHLEAARVQRVDDVSP
jgi:hypothetical protein